MGTVRLLAVAQAFSAAGMMAMFLFGGIVGSELAPSPQLATLPLSLVIVGLALTTVPAALAMQRFGRRRAFIGSALLAAAAAVAVAGAIVVASFALLCAASVALGANLAFQQQQRFAAAESVAAEQASRAISVLMLGGLALCACGVIVDSWGRALEHYWWGLVLLGLGWNLLFVSGTALLTSSYLPAERYRAQAVNEFAVFGAQAAVSLLAGPALYVLGWTRMNLATVPLLAAFGLVLLASTSTARGGAVLSGRETR